MKLLLDTNAFVRWIAGSPLPHATGRVLARQNTLLLVSIVTGWEIIMKPKLNLGAADVEAAIGEMGATLLPIKFDHLNRLSHLPFYEDHRDPFDRMLIAQALIEDTPIVTSDARFSRYKGLRVLWD
ncbi:MAG: type II toxin-antitoxin system VapC family toxin [Bryobacteraceae bacterium]